MSKKLASQVVTWNEEEVKDVARFRQVFDPKGDQKAMRKAIKEIVHDVQILSLNYRVKIQITDLVNGSEKSKEFVASLEAFVGGMEKGKKDYYSKKIDRLPYAPGEMYDTRLTGILEHIKSVMNEDDPALKKEVLREFVDQQQGQLIWMLKDHKFETKEEVAFRKKLHVEVFQQAIGKSNEKSFPEYKMGDIA